MRGPGPTGLLLAVCLILGLLGPLDVATERIALAMALAAWGAGRAGPAGLAVGLGGVLLAMIPSVEGKLAVVAGAALLVPSSSRRADVGFTAALLGWRLLVDGIPWLWMWGVEISRLGSRMVGSITGQMLDLGPTASGLHLYLVFILFAAARTACGSLWSWRRLLLATLGLAVFMAILPAVGSASWGGLFDAGAPLNMAREHLAPTPGRTARLMLGWSWAFFALLLTVWLSGHGSGPGRRPDRRRAPMPPLVHAAAGLLLAALLIAASAPAGDRRPGEIVILRSPAFDMDIPTPQRLGAGRAGMFGMLPGYLALDGHRVRLHEGPLTMGALRGASILIVALPVSPLDEAGAEAVRAFVADGGSLLALGDHTDLLGIMEPMNRLLSPWGIGLRFDSAYPAVREWRGCVEGPSLGRHDITGTGTGASLWIGAGVRPVIVGRYAHADAGDRANTGRGAFLGNYAYDPGEQLSDLVLAAKAVHGRGQVVVFGDTSAFQNIMMPFSYRYVMDLMDGLARPSPRAADRWRLAAGVLAAMLALPALFGWRGTASALSAGVLAACLETASPARGGGPLERLPGDARVAYVDAGHLNRFSLDLWHGDSIGGLIVNLERDGYLPVVVKEGLHAVRLGRKQLVVIPAPRVPLSTAEVRGLAAHLDRGGTVLVAAGAREESAVAPLLSPHGVRIGSLPLGPVPVRDALDHDTLEAARKEPRFNEAWPVETSGPDPAVSLYRAFDLDVAIRLETGRYGGKLIVIGDPTFPTDRVLENETTAWEGNIAFLSGILAPGDER